MRRFILVVLVVLVLPACSQKVSQRGGFTINYLPVPEAQGEGVAQAEFLPADVPEVYVVATEGRADPTRDIVADARPTTVRERLASWAVYGIFSIWVDAQIQQSPNQDFVDAFREAMARRLNAEGVPVAQEDGDGLATLEILVKTIRLDYGSFNGEYALKWKGEVAYSGQMRKGDTILCSQDVHEIAMHDSTAQNKTGQDTLDQAFTQAINAFDWRACSGVGQAAEGNP